MNQDDGQAKEQGETTPATAQDVILTPDTIAEALRRAMLAAPELEDQIRSVFEPSESGVPLRRP